jgi:hypothetical protein
MGNKTWILLMKMRLPDTLFKPLSFICYPALLSLLGSCALFYPPGYNPPPGLLYQNTSMNHQIDTPTDLGNKSGSACVTGFFWLISTGNASIQAAAASKGIRTIKAVDYTITSFAGGLYNRVCTVVHGE